MLQVDGLQTETFSRGIARGDATLTCCPLLQVNSRGSYSRLRFPTQFGGPGQCNCNSEPLLIYTFANLPVSKGKMLPRPWAKNYA